MDFRTLYAFNSKEAIIANAGSPANIMRTKDGGITWKIIYANKDSLAFFDGIDFWNDSEGIISGAESKSDTEGLGCAMCLKRVFPNDDRYTQRHEPPRRTLIESYKAIAAINHIREDDKTT